MENFILLSFISLLFCMFFYKNSYMYMIILFEFIFLFIFFSFCIFMHNYDYSLMSSMVFISLMVMEGGVAISVLIYSIIRKGDDNCKMILFFY